MCPVASVRPLRSVVVSPDFDAKNELSWSPPTKMAHFFARSEEAIEPGAQEANGFSRGRNVGIGKNNLFLLKEKFYLYYI